LRAGAVDDAIGDRIPLVVAAGKAAAEMASAFVSVEARSGLRGLVASPQAGTAAGNLEWFDVGHPVPTAGSVAAGRRALALAAALGPDEVMVLLLSGGASAGLAVPIDGLTLEDKSAVTSVLLRAGVAIDGLNCVRKHLSAIKGGRLAVAAGGRVLTLAISDVVDPEPDDPTVIGSGPTTPDPTTFAEALAICRAAGGAGTLPRLALDALERGVRGERAESPKPGDARLAGASYHLIGSRRDAVEGAARKARELGFSVAVIDEPVTGEARRAGEGYVRTIARLAHEQPRPLCIVSAGETTVQVTGGGRGGRNQEFALATAFHLVRRFPDAVIASVGTDGIDGPTDAAGAVVDTTTPARAAERDLRRPEHYLAANDSYTFFEALGDLIRTGPTDTNVGDLQVALIA
jgi:hydroxypyruvate reductase